jgi:hypothetical protein
LISPFAALNLRLNPFGAPFRHERGELAVPAVDLDALADRLGRERCAIQLRGRPGSGKTTHLCALHTYFPGAPFVVIPEHGPAPSIPAAPLVFVDESQRLPKRTRRALFRRPASFVLATHQCHARELRPRTVHEVELFGLPPVALARYAAVRMEWARLGDGALPEVPAALLDALLRAHGGDVRAIENALYGWLQSLKDEIHARHELHRPLEPNAPA